MKTRFFIALFLLFTGVTEAQLSFNKFLGIKVSSSNTLVGVSAGSAVTTGNKNTYIGRYKGVGRETLSNQIVLSDGDGNVRAINNAGNWLIGKTVDAGYQFDVAGNIKSDNIYTSGIDGVYVMNPNNNNAHCKIQFFNDVPRIRLGGTGVGAVNGLDIQGSGDVSLLRILANGKVGIGTSSPNGKLDVIGDIQIVKTSTGTEKALKVNNSVGARVFELTTTEIATNIGLGLSALNVITTGAENTAVGHLAGLSTTIGNSNTYVGKSAGVLNVDGSGNTAVGGLAGANFVSTQGTVCVGYGAGRYLSDGTSPNVTSNNSIYLGYQSKANANAQNNQIVIGSFAVGNGSNTTVIGMENTLNTRLYGSLLIGTNTAVSSAIANFSSTTQGVLLPRLTTAQINAIVSPVNGLYVHNIDLNTPCFYDGTGWRKVSHSAM